MNIYTATEKKALASVKQNRPFARKIHALFLLKITVYIYIYIWEINAQNTYSAQQVYYYKLY